MKHEPRGKSQDTSGWNSGNFSCLGQETNRAGILQFMDICWENLHKSFSCHLFYPDNIYTTKAPMNNLRKIMF